MKKVTFMDIRPPSSNLTDDDRKRIDSILQGLLEVASGNFNYMIERSDRDDELEAVVVTLNMTTEELNASFMHRDHLNLNDADKNAPGMTFVLDDDLTIQTFNPDVMQTLFFTPQEIKGRPFEDFLTPESRIAWESLKPRLTWHDDPCFTVTLYFKTKRPFVFPTDCSVSTLFNTPKHQRKILITAIETIRRTKEAEDPEPYSSDLVVDRNAMRSGYFREADFLKMHEARNMLQDLQSQWSLSLLADKVGMERRTLTKMFKKLYGKAVMAFLLEERMKKAMELLQHSNIQLKEIALKVGYKYLPNFSKAFKQRFGYPPKAVRQRNFTENRKTQE